MRADGIRGHHRREEPVGRVLGRIGGGHHADERQHHDQHGQRRAPPEQQGRGGHHDRGDPGAQRVVAGAAYHLGEPESEDREGYGDIERGTAHGPTIDQVRAGRIRSAADLEIPRVADGNLPSAADDGGLCRP